MKTKQKLDPKKIVGFILLFILIGFSKTVNAASFFQDISNQEVTEYNQYKGKVIDSDTKKPLIFASLAIEDTNISTVTNTEGDFLLKIPKDITSKNITISFLGYKTKLISLASLKESNNRIALDISVTQLDGVNITIPKDVTSLVREVFEKKGDNYFNDPTLMTAFYRETIKKRRKNVSLSEAVVNIYKTPYNSTSNDAVELYKARKSTDYNKLDTVALKLQGGPFNTLFVDVMKYPEYIFSNERINHYNFNYERSTTINGKLISIVNFKQKDYIKDQLYEGKLFIDANDKILTSAIYALNITDKAAAARLFVKRKPKKANVWPKKVAYRVDYREKNGKWHYGYSNVFLEFKINWADKLFNSVYSMSAEMAITDWKKNLTRDKLKQKDKLKSSVILADEAIGFSDPNFWGEYNIIEPEKSIESAIKKIKKQLNKS